MPVFFRAFFSPPYWFAYIHEKLRLLSLVVMVYLRQTTGQFNGNVFSRGAGCQFVMQYSCIYKERQMQIIPTIHAPPSPQNVFLNKYKTPCQYLWYVPIPNEI